jgi:hypothetical protein
MKLVELLAKVLIEWPTGAGLAVQDGDAGKTVKFGHSTATPSIALMGRENTWQAKNWSFNAYSDFDHSVLASDWETSIVTHEMWQAERDRQKGGEWKRHRGGFTKLDSDVRVEVKLRNGDTFKALTEDLTWRHDECLSCDNIMQYRVISQPQAEEVEMKTAFSEHVESVSNIKVSVNDGGKFVIDQIDGQIKWRDTVIHCQAIIEDCEREIAKNENLLALEGFALIPAMTPVMGVAPFSLPYAEWKVGDFVVSKVDYNNQFTKSKKYTVTGTYVSLGENRVSVEEDDKGEANGWLAKNFEFHSRP